MPPKSKVTPKKTRKRKSSTKQKQNKGGSAASDAVTRQVSSSGWKGLGVQSTYPGLSGGAISFGKLFRPSKYTLTHQTLQRGGTVPPTKSPSGHIPNRSGTVGDAMVMNTDSVFHPLPTMAQYPSNIRGNSVPFQMGGHFPSLKELKRDLQKVFGLKPKRKSRR